MTVNLPINIWIGNDEKGEAPFPVERSLVLKGVRLVLGLVQALGHHLVEHGHLGHQRRLLGARRVLHGGGGGARHWGVPRRHAPSLASFTEINHHRVLSSMGKIMLISPVKL